MQHCFAGLFNGARTGTLLNGGLSVGKAECEWDWAEVWPRIVALGLVEFSVRPRRNHPDAAVDPYTAVFDWRITDRGLEVRADDLKYHYELMAAIDADEAEDAAHDDRR